MIFLSLFILLAFSVFAFAQDTNLAEVKKAFDGAKIPATINLDPKVLLEATFPQPATKSITLHAGIRLTRNGSQSEGPFVVAAIDPDAPTPQAPTKARIRHFVAGNFFLQTLKDSTLLVNKTPAVSDFFRPTPPAGSDPHRYIFLLFDQSKGFNEQKLVNSTTPITFFNISSFAAALGLGQPLGGTFMLVGPDPST